MKQLLEQKLIVGKTIKSIREKENAFCLLFTDNTFCIIKGGGYGDWEVEFDSNKVDTTFISSLNVKK